MNAEGSPTRHAVMKNKPRRSTTATALAAAGCLLLVSCGGGSNTIAADQSGSGVNVTVGGAGALSNAITPAGGAGAKGGSDPCSLLTQAEAETAVGQPLGVGKQTATLDDCAWSSTDFTANVDVTVSSWSAIKTAATANGHTPASVTGVGDEALTNGPLLSVRKGDAGFLLVIGGPNIDSRADHGLAQEKVLAAAILGRM
jgi:hypothetical protein